VRRRDLDQRLAAAHQRQGALGANDVARLIGSVEDQN
jgi:hypothetical protein